MNKKRRGFTIIETMLVLAITGLVAAVILTGIGVSLRNERYRDAVNQTLDFFQGQYSLAANISNDRPSSDSCSADGILLDSAGTGRGTSSCFIVGRILRSEDGQTIKSTQAIARADVADPSMFPSEDTKSDSQVFHDASIIEGGASSTYRLEWDVRLLRPGTPAPASFTILIARSPLTGAIHTYTSGSGTESISSLLSMQDQARFCIDPSGLMNTGVAPVGIVIDKDAANSTGVRQLSPEDC